MVKLILMVMLLGVIMSTADSFLNALVVVVIRDIIQYKQKKKELDFAQLTHVKTIALTAGLASMGLAYLFSSFEMYSATLADSSKDVFGCFAIFVIAAAFKLKGNTKIFFDTLGVFLSLFILVGILFYTNTVVIGGEAYWKNLLFRRKMGYAVVPILLVTAIVFLLIHKDVYGRLTWEQPKVKGETVRQMGGTREKWHTIFSNPLVWAKDTFARYGNEPTAVGFFLALSSVVRVTIAPRFHTGYMMIFTVLNLLALLLCTLLMIHVMWRQPFKSYFPLFYYGALVYILPFMHMLLFLYQPMSTILLIQLVLSIVLLHLLVDWRSYCFFTIIGWGLAWIVYRETYLPPENPGLQTITRNLYDYIWIGFVAIASAIGLGFLFCSRQEQINTQRLMRTKTYAAGFGHDLLNLYQCPQSTIDYVQNAYTQGRKDMINEAQEWNDMARYMQECADQAHAFKKLVKFDYIPQSEIKVMSMKALIEKAYGLIPSFLRDRVRIAASRDFKVEVFPPFVNNIILNLVKNAQKHGNAKEVVLSWDAATRRLYIQDDGSGIPAHIASKIRDLYTTSTKDGTGSGIGLAFVFMVVEDIFKAEIDFETSNKGTTFWIEFPLIKRG
ncbi:MAG: ATP-binding protein, partial [Bacteroidota bacterium]